MAKKWKDLSPEEKMLRILGNHQANVSLAKDAVRKLLRVKSIEDAGFYRKLQRCYEAACQLEEHFNKCSNHMYERVYELRAGRICLVERAKIDGAP